MKPTTHSILSAYLLKAKGLWKPEALIDVRESNGMSRLYGVRPLPGASSGQAGPEEEKNSKPAPGRNSGITKK